MRNIIVVRVNSRKNAGSLLYDWLTQDQGFGGGLISQPVNKEKGIKVTSTLRDIGEYFTILELEVVVKTIDEEGKETTHLTKEQAANHDQFLVSLNQFLRTIGH